MCTTYRDTLKDWEASEYTSTIPAVGSWMCESFARGCQIKYPLLVGTEHHNPLGIHSGKKTGKKEGGKGLNTTNGKKTLTISDMAYQILSSYLL